jgi:hypothetical protein
VDSVGTVVVDTLRVVVVDVEPSWVVVVVVDGVDVVDEFSGCVEVVLVVDGVVVVVLQCFPPYWQ